VALKFSLVPLQILGNLSYLCSRSWLHLFPNPALDGCELSATPSSCFDPRGKSTWYPCDSRSFWPRSGSGLCGNISVFLGGEPRSPCCPSRIIVTVPTEISRLLISESFALRILLSCKSCYLLSLFLLKYPTTSVLAVVGGTKI